MTAALAPTLFSTLACIRLLAAPDESEKIAQSTGSDGLRPSRRRITACDQRFEGYPSMLACYRLGGVLLAHEYLYYDSSGQRRAEPQLTGLGTSCAPPYFSLSSQRNIPMRRKTHTQLFSQRNIPGNASQKGNATQQVPPRRLCHTGAPPRRLHYVSFHHIRFCVICFQHILVLFHIRWEPLATRPLPYYLAAFCITNYSKTALAKRPIPQSGVSGSGCVMRGRKGG